jgi:hypothetical protein
MSLQLESLCPRSEFIQGTDSIPVRGVHLHHVQITVSEMTFQIRFFPRSLKEEGLRPHTLVTLISFSVYSKRKDTHTLVIPMQISASFQRTSQNKKMI